jgi:hypothetical protein
MAMRIPSWLTIMCNTLPTGTPRALSASFAEVASWSCCFFVSPCHGTTVDDLDKARGGGSKTLRRKTGIP